MSTLVDEYMAETIRFGGFPLTRTTVHSYLVKEGFPGKALDIFVYAAPAVDEVPLDPAVFFATVYGHEDTEDEEKVA